jgi:hypothetical protein
MMQYVFQITLVFVVIAIIPTLKFVWMNTFLLLPDLNKVISKYTTIMLYVKNRIRIISEEC